MWDLYLFDRFEAAAAAVVVGGSKMCSQIFVPDLAPLNFKEIPMIFYTHISWAVPECSAKFGPNCSKFREMAAILNQKNSYFALFSLSILVIPTKLGRDITRGKGHLLIKRP